MAALAAKLGKTTALSEDFPGFMANRILMPMINEAVYTLYEGVGTIAGIDCTLKLGCNHPMGPLELADFIGLDTCLSIMQVLLDGLSDTKYRPCPLLVKYVEAGWLGRKTGRGFYDYSVTPPRPRAERSQHLATLGLLSAWPHWLCQTTKPSGSFLKKEPKNFCFLKRALRDSPRQPIKVFCCFF